MTETIDRHVDGNVTISADYFRELIQCKHKMEELQHLCWERLDRINILVDRIKILENLLHATQTKEVLGDEQPKPAD